MHEATEVNTTYSLGNKIRKRLGQCFAQGNQAVGLPNDKHPLFSSSRTKLALVDTNLAVLLTLLRPNSRQLKMIIQICLGVVGLLQQRCLSVVLPPSLPNSNFMLAIFMQKLSPLPHLDKHLLRLIDSVIVRMCPTGRNLLLPQDNLPNQCKLIYFTVSSLNP